MIKANNVEDFGVSTEEFNAPYNAVTTPAKTPLAHAQQALVDEQVLADIWSNIRARLLAEYSRSTFDHWLKDLTFHGLEGTEIVLSLPNNFMRDWVQSHFSDRLRSLWMTHLRGVSGVSFIVVSRQADGVRAVIAPSSPVCDQPRAEPSSSSSSATVPASVATERSDYVSGSPLDPRYTFEHFVVGHSNQFAYSAAKRIVEGGAVAFNPLFLHSSVGLGKTHLMHAMAWEIRRRHPERRVVYLSAEKFMVEFVSALRHQDTVAFKQRFRTVDVLMVDDVQFIAGKNSTQDEFFHTFNALIDYRRQLVISADRSPSDLEGIEERIRSRLGWGLVADIHPTDFELRLGILQSKLESMPEATVPRSVLEFLAQRINNNVRELEGALNRVVAHATVTGKAIDIEFARTALQNLIRANDRRITIDEIQRRVAEHYKIRLADLLSARRSRDIARPRQIAMYLAKRLTPRSLPEIGRKFGGRDHTTVMHAIKRIEELRGSDSDLEGSVTNLMRQLDG